MSENTKAISVLGAHAQGEACGKHRRIVPGVSKHQDDQWFWWLHLRRRFPEGWRFFSSACICTKWTGSPLLRNFLLPDAHTRRKRPSPLPCEVSKHQTPGPTIPTWGGSVPKESLNPFSGTRHPDFNFTVRTLLRCWTFPKVAWVLHKSGYSSLVLEMWPWSHISLLFITVLRYWGLTWCCPLHGLSYPWVSGGDSVNALTWRRLNLATPHLGDASSWQRLKRSTCWLSSLGPFEGSHHTLTLTLVNARGRDGTLIVFNNV